MRGITAAPTLAKQAMVRLRHAAYDAGLRVQMCGEGVLLSRFGHQVRIDAGTGWWLLTLEGGTRRYPRTEDGALALATDASAAVDALAARSRSRTVRPARTTPAEGSR
ncbi:hypothetical protein MRI28_25630 [Nocardiopsis dassonvillei]|uniref:hypothetical protein n=1 Tax=Nocardiopsis dassonvillei TaxID=2014 RepID=UPI00200D9EC8|nr:hypothetical protein [Nocardiopsis dassonvillei]MCK9872970.1 hypothetical protein [Nocardiopsis dassonvillei]